MKVSLKKGFILQNQWRNGEWKKKKKEPNIKQYSQEDYTWIGSLEVSHEFISTFKLLK